MRAGLGIFRDVGPAKPGGPAANRWSLRATPACACISAVRFGKKWRFASAQRYGISRPNLVAAGVGNEIGANPDFFIASINGGRAWNSLRLRFRGWLFVQRPSIS